MVESQPSKLLVAGSIPASRSRNTVASEQWQVASNGVIQSGFNLPLFTGH